MEPFQPSHVTVVGDALLDVRVRPMAAPRPGADVPATIGLAPGGQGANVAVRLARAGLAVTLHCGLGDDPAGDLLRAAIAGDGVEVRPVPVPSTGTVVVQLDATGERTMFSQRAPFAAALSAGDLETAGGWTVLSGYALLEDVDELVGSLAEQPGRRLVLGCAVPLERRERWVALAASLRPHLVVLNRDEADALHLDLAADGVVVTTDAGRASAHVDGRRIDAPAEGPTAVVDSTGAGDAFAAGLVAHLVGVGRTWPPDERELVEALTAGSRLAREVTGVEGAQTLVPSERPGVPS